MRVVRPFGLVAAVDVLKKIAVYPAHVGLVLQLVILAPSKHFRDKFLNVNLVDHILVQLVDDLTLSLIYKVPFTCYPLDFKQVLATHLISVSNPELVKLAARVSKHNRFYI